MNLVEKHKLRQLTAEKGLGSGLTVAQVAKLNQLASEQLAEEFGREPRMSSKKELLWATKTLNYIQNELLNCLPLIFTEELPIWAYSPHFPKEAI